MKATVIVLLVLAAALALAGTFLAPGDRQPTCLLAFIVALGFVGLILK